ncbi:MAG: GAF domain-containing protein [Gemmataceae bacterium]|nr:GAF domain-containing protein [Gemmataceae bacterium]
MQASSLPEPQRQADLARLSLTKLNVEEKISLIEFFQKTSVVCADFLNVERVGIWLLVNEGKALRCVELFEKSKRNHIVGPTLIVSDYPSYFSSISQRKTLPIESVETDPRTQELLEGYLRPLKISSMLDGPIFINGELVGIICHEHTGPVREWSTEERDFVGSIADIIALKKFEPPRWAKFASLYELRNPNWPSTVGWMPSPKWRQGWPMISRIS